MKHIDLFTSGVIMLSSYRQPSIFCKLMLVMLLGSTVSGCATVERIYTDSVNKIDIQGSIDKAKTWIFNEKQEEIIESPENDLQFAIQQFNQNKFAIAEFYLKKTLVKFPDNPTAIKLLPWTYFYQKRYDKALKAFERTKMHYPKNPEPLIGMGWCYFGLKNFTRATERFEGAEKLAGDPYQIHKGKGFILLKMNKKSSAEKEFSHIYSPSETDHIFALWSDWHKKDADVLIDIIPATPEDVSLFTLPTEHPRYPSTMLGMPRNDDPAIEVAWSAYWRGSFKKALEEFKDISKDPNSPDVKNGLAWSYLQNRQIKTASKLFDDILRIWPNFIGALKGKEEIENIKRRQAVYADYYFDLNKLSIAEKKYAELQSIYPDWKYSYIQLGKVKLAREDYPDAREQFLDALELAPNDPSAKMGMDEVRKVMDSSLFQADQSLKSGDYKTAALIYAEYIEEQKSGKSSLPKLSHLMDKLGFNNSSNKNSLIPSNESSLAHAYNGLGWSQMQKKKYLQAASKFEIARADREYYLESSRGLGLALFEAGEYKRSAEALKPVIEANPDDLSLAYKMDVSILMSWDAPSAHKYFTETLIYHPLRASLYMGLGWIHYKNGNPDLGVEYFLKAISLDPDFALTDEFRAILAKERFGWQVYNRFGWKYYEKEDYKNAFVMFQTALKEQPNKSESRKGLGYILAKVGKLNSSVKYLNQVLAINPDPTPVKEMVTGNDAIAPYEKTTTTRTTLGNIMLKQDNPFEAIALFQRELELRPHLSAAHDGLGWAYLKLNRLAESRTAFKAAIKYQPLNNLSHKGLREVKQRIANKNMGDSTSLISSRALPKKRTPKTYQN